MLSSVFSKWIVVQYSWETCVISFPSPCQLGGIMWDFEGSITTPLVEDWFVTVCLWLISGSREYSEDSLKLACDYQSELDASFGGTEILQPLQAIYGKPPMSTHSRQVCWLLAQMSQLMCFTTNVFCLMVNLSFQFCLPACCSIVTNSSWIIPGT